MVSRRCSFPALRSVLRIEDAFICEHEICSNPLAMAKKKVLIVEDNSDVRRLYAIGLNQRGFEVKLASDGAQAVERIRTEKPDVILLDWIMPVMNGPEVLEHISRDGESPIPIIVISGQPAPPEVDHRIRCWLTKPVGIDELVSTIDSRARTAEDSQVR